MSNFTEDEWAMLITLRQIGQTSGEVRLSPTCFNKLLNEIETMRRTWIAPDQLVKTLKDIASVQQVKGATGEVLLR